MTTDNKIYRILAPPRPRLPGRGIEEINNVRGWREKGPHACAYLEENGYRSPQMGSGFNEPASIGEVVVRPDERPFRDFEFYSEYFILSERALRLFEHIAPDVVVSKKVDVREEKGGRRDDIGNYYACDVVLFLDAVDEARTNIQWLVEGKLYETPSHYVLKSKVIGHKPIFRQLKSPRYVYCNDETRLRFKQEKMTGVKFLGVGEIV